MDIKSYSITEPEMKPVKSGSLRAKSDLNG